VTDNQKDRHIDRQTYYFVNELPHSVSLNHCLSNGRQHGMKIAVFSHLTSPPLTFVKHSTHGFRN